MTLDTSESEHMPEPSHDRPQNRFMNGRFVGLALILIGLEILYAFYGSAGRILTDWPVYQAYYDMLAEGFRAGQLHLAYTPRPELLAADDPWSLRYGRYWLGDGSFYGGKYYLYWGPAPALLQAGIKSLLGINRIIGDQYLTFAAFSILTISSCALVSRMVTRLFPATPFWLVALGVITVGCANPVLHLVSTGGVYQAAISFAQAFLVLGLFWALEAVWRAHLSERSWPYLIAAGFTWGLSLSCRFSQAASIGLLMLGTVVSIQWCKAAKTADSAHATPDPVPKTHSPSLATFVRPFLINCLAVGLPVLAFVLALLFYNKARFDEYFEFGTTWMTTSVKFRWSTIYWPANIYAYLLQTFEANGTFPFLHQMTHFSRDTIPSWVNYPEDLIMHEPVVGLLKSAPISWLSVVAAYFAVKKWLGRRGRVFTDHDRLYTAYFVGFLIIATVSAGPALGVYITTMRYLADFTHGFLLLGLLGGYSLCASADAAKPESLRPPLRIVTTSAMSLLGVTTILFGFAFGVQGYAHHFKRFNPELFQQWVTSLSFEQPDSK